MKPKIKDLSTLKKLLVKGNITRMKLNHSKVNSVHVGTVREVGNVQEDAFTLRDSGGNKSWFEYPDLSKFSFDGSSIFRIVNNGEVVLEYECFCDSEIQEEELVEKRLYRRSSIMKELLKEKKYDTV